MTVERRTVTIENIERRSSSKNGNPGFRVATDGGSWLTAVDASCAYAIENEEYQGVEVVLTIDKDRIVGISTVDGAIFSGRQS